MPSGFKLVFLGVNMMLFLPLSRLQAISPRPLLNEAKGGLICRPLHVKATSAKHRFGLNHHGSGWHHLFDVRKTHGHPKSGPYVAIRSPRNHRWISRECLLKLLTPSVVDRMFGFPLMCPNGLSGGHGYFFIARLKYTIYIYLLCGGPISRLD